MNSVVFARQLAEVVRRLRDLRIGAGDDQLETKILTVFQTVLGGGTDVRPAHIDIDLPDLQEGYEAEIVPANVTALSAIYFGAQLEDLKFFMVADRVVDQFLHGLIPLSKTIGAGEIFRYYKDAVKRFTEAERRGLFARCFGFAQGAVEEELPNREFNDLWIRFLSSVNTVAREYDLNGRPRDGVRPTITVQTMFKNGRDLGVNLSLHGYGVAHFAAVELQEQIKLLLKILSYNEVLQAYGVLDVWQLVERVSGLYLGGAVNSVRQRTLAQSGANIIKWISKYSHLLQNAGRQLRFDLTIRDNEELVANVDSVLAVTGTDDQSIDRYSDAVSLATQPTIPDMSLRAIPDAIQEVLSGNGINTALQQGLAGLGAIAKA